MDYFHLKKFIRQSSIVICLCMASILIYAVFQATYDVENTFPLLRSNVSLREEFTPLEGWKGEELTKKVTLHNDGDLPVLLRVSFSEQWIQNDRILSNVMERDGVVESVVQKQCVSNGWLEQSLNWGKNDKDQWYYYAYVLAPDEEITILETIQIADMQLLSKEYQDAQYQLRFHYEYVQKGEEVRAAWNHGDEYEVGNDGRITWKF